MSFKIFGVFPEVCLSQARETKGLVSGVAYSAIER